MSMDRSPAVRIWGFLDIWEPWWSFCSFPASHFSHMKVQINFPLRGKLSQSLITWKTPEISICSSTSALPSMFEKHMKWAKYTPLMLRGGSTPSFPEERLSRLTPPYFYSAEAQTSQQISGGHYIWTVNLWLQESLKEILSTVDCL